MQCVGHAPTSLNGFKVLQGVLHRNLFSRLLLGYDDSMSLCFHVVRYEVDS